MLINTGKIKLLAVLLLLVPGLVQAQDRLSRGLFSDVKAHEVGDVVLVLIVETADATRESKVNSSMESDMAVGGGVTGTLTNFLPLFGADASMGNSHKGSEGTEQKERLTGKITATITKKKPNGDFRIEGERVLEVNGETNLMKLSGSVRAKDIQANNSVYSYNIADAKITYRKTGLSNAVSKPGAMQRWGTWILGVGLLAVAVVGVS
ncbi:MAG: flagellar basal body L-ring protein FlgH [Candidatus Neomarinimicrobiota bacterium]